MFPDLDDGCRPENEWIREFLIKTIASDPDGKNRTLPIAEYISQIHQGIDALNAEIIARPFDLDLFRQCIYEPLISPNSTFFHRVNRCGICGRLMLPVSMKIWYCGPECRKLANNKHR